MRTVRTECLDWTLIWNARHLHWVLAEFLRHYNTARPHRGLNLGIPMPGPTGTVTPLPTAVRLADVERVDILGGLIHEYHRAA